MDNRTDVDTQNINPNNKLNYLKISIDPPYLKPPETVLNDLGLPIRKYYTIKDLFKVFNIKPDAFRYRIKKGYYGELMRVGKKVGLMSWKSVRLSKQSKYSSGRNLHKGRDNF
jgi:hypothetical protein